MTPAVLEALALRCALGNNGGQWATHYTEDQKQHWRQFVSDLVEEVEAETREADAAIAETMGNNKIAAAIRARGKP